MCTEYGCVVEGEQGVEDGYTFLKFEPFVLHVMCRGLEHAQAMVVPPLVLCCDVLTQPLYSCRPQWELGLETLV